MTWMRALAIAFAVALAGCSLTRPAPVKNTFLLDPPFPPAVTAAKPATLRIGNAGRLYIRLKPSEPNNRRLFGARHSSSDSRRFRRSM